MRFAALPFLPQALLFLAVSALTRLGLSLQAGFDQVPVALWPGLFWRGLAFDLAVLAWLLAPMLVWAALWPERWRNTRWRGGLRLATFFALAFVLLFSALAEWTFWEEFETRFNFIAVDYLVYTYEVIGNILESYPVAALLSGIAVAAALMTGWFRRPIRAAAEPAPQLRWRLYYAALACALPWCSWHLADIDQMQYSDNTYAVTIQPWRAVAWAASPGR